MCRDTCSSGMTNRSPKKKQQQQQYSSSTSSNSTLATSASTATLDSLDPPPPPQDDSTAAFYQFDVANLPDTLFHSHVPVEKWLATCTTTNNTSGFPPNSLNQIHPIEWAVELERIVGFTLYQFLNVFPFMILPLLILYFGVATPLARCAVLLVLAYVAVLSFFTAILEPVFLHKYQQSRFLLAGMKDVHRNQYVYTERNTTKYLSVKFVWPQSVHRPQLEDTPVLFCIVPHGVVSWGIAAYPLWSKLWNDRICRWAMAPVVLKIPIVRYLARKVGYIPAKAQPILETLTKRQENVGVVLDGIAGMFQFHTQQETAFIQQRKGIVKIALRAGVPIVPVYGFGHTSLYTVCVDPLGVLERVSQKLQVSLTPFTGRWGWILGPPRRVPVTVALGDPVFCPQIADPTQEDIDTYHAELLDKYRVLFETHKTAYGWQHKSLRFV
ncbi:Diacylglycerol O-acyltransferase 2-like protein 6 [Seminavis robusta]|uniref:Acyltransferase n=1 Tax=Seminavis robusta TaxID=568900 RepID=A0A9N8EKM6_9STRA|nr:Diacylglycerol O-acyltransferase 2-like protein 6 [Seminavis robusta]|eukprot:Sro1235_g255010.1 Diacylglycerol O-acyltransferase 2-like protein 6 (440) ;mRNA; r:16734-18053